MVMGRARAQTWAAPQLVALLALQLTVASLPTSYSGLHARGDGAQLQQQAATADPDVRGQAVIHHLHAQDTGHVHGDERCNDHAPGMDSTVAKKLRASLYEMRLRRLNQKKVLPPDRV